MTGVQVHRWYRRGSETQHVAIVAVHLHCQLQSPSMLASPCTLSSPCCAALHIALLPLPDPMSVLTSQSGAAHRPCRGKAGGG